MLERSPPVLLRSLKLKKEARAGPKKGKYRDRAKERQQGLNLDYKETEKYETVEIAPELTKYLGGSMERTHLVKGLDFALLERMELEQEQQADDDRNAPWK